MATEQRTAAQDLERRAEELQHQETFEPPPEFRERALLSDPSVYEEAAADPVAWWERHADELTWFERWERALDESEAPFYKWFAGGKTNISYNCLDRHVEAGNADRIAVLWRGEEGEERQLTYGELLRDVKRFANALKDQGVGKGDVVGVYLPMIPEVVVAMLACTRIGAIHNVVFGGFAVHQMRERMRISQAKALIVPNEARRKGQATPVKENVEGVLADIPSLETVIVVAHTDAEPPMQEGRDVWFHEIAAAAEEECEAEALDAEDPAYILYTSGSTGAPKGILHTTGGYLTGVYTTCKYVFDLRPEEDIFWCTADVGWVTGHSYIVYGPLANGVTTFVYEGTPDYPDKDAWWDLVERYGVTVFYTAPTAIRACMKWGVEYPQRHDLSSLRLLGTVGEPINPKAWTWYHVVIGGERCPIVDTWWQTETGHIMISPLPGITATKPGSATRPLPGIFPSILGEAGNEIEPSADPDGGKGALVLRRPWPGMLRTLYGDPQRFRESYFETYGPETYEVGDAAKRDADGYFWIIGRTDDQINVSGHRMSTAEIEGAIVAAESVAEAAVIGQSDEDTGQAVTAFVTLEGGREGDESTEKEIHDKVVERIGKLARPKRLIWAEDLPKTRSGKIMRRILRNLTEGEDVGDTTTLADPSVVDVLQEKVRADQGRDGR